MPEYKLRFTDETQESDGRQETLNDLINFMKEIEGLTMTVVTLDDEQSENWDKDDKSDFDYQDFYGREIIQQIQTQDPDTACVVIRNAQQQPVAMAAKSPEDPGWQGIGIDVRLRTDIRNMIGLDDYELEEPL
ncbi:MAG: hypothetical protein QF493_11590 [Rhodospirillales bacterium]|jgi:hypothetical protein|nr:hypothetical protein [Arenicellales bacterium]MDP7625581.1 hypothetical protein [Rhodospirillales bacterium]